MIYAATNGPATLIVEPDTDPVDPRVDCEPFGHLVCWHRRYFLGDGHHYETPWDCLRELCSSYVQDDDALDDMSIDELKAVLARQLDLVILPVYLYDHSGLAMSTGSFLGRAPHADWDSGQVGYIYATSEDILKTFGDITPETVKRAREALEAEVRAYDAYLRGDCWGYRAFMYGREMDACWGFLGDIDEVKPVIASCLAPGWNSLVDKLQLHYQSAKEYLYDTTVA